MTKWIATVTLAVGMLMMPAVSSQETGNFKDIFIEQAPEVIGNYKSGNFVEQMRGGVKLTILAEDEADNLKVEANTIDFDYGTEGDQTPTSLTLTGKVVIENAEMRIVAPKAILNTKTNMAEFIGETDIYSADRAPVRADEVVVDMNTGNINMKNVRSIKAE